MSYDEEEELFLVEYSDGDREELWIHELEPRLLAESAHITAITEEPAVSAADPSISAAAAAQTQLAGSGQVPVPNAYEQQRLPQIAANEAKPGRQNLLHLVLEEVQHFHPQPRHLPKSFQHGSMTQTIVRGSVQLSMMMRSLHLHWFGTDCILGCCTLMNQIRTHTECR